MCLLYVSQSHKNMAQTQFKLSMSCRPQTPISKIFRFALVNNIFLKHVVQAQYLKCSPNRYWNLRNVRNEKRKGIPKTAGASRSKIFNQTLKGGGLRVARIYGMLVCQCFSMKIPVPPVIIWP